MNTALLASLVVGHSFAARTWPNSVVSNLLAPFLNLGSSVNEYETGHSYKGIEGVGLVVRSLGWCVGGDGVGT
jgi:hypothetical protein